MSFILRSLACRTPGYETALVSGKLFLLVGLSFFVAALPLHALYRNQLYRRLTRIMVLPRQMQFMLNYSKSTIMSLESFDFLRPLVASIPEPASEDAKPPPQRKASRSNAGALSSRGGAKRKDQPGAVKQEVSVPEAGADSLPSIGTWRRDEGGGSGEGGRGLYDDYEDDEDYDE